MAEAWRWNPKKRAVNHLLGGPQRHTALVGGSRSGKTALICRAILTRSLRAPHSRHLMARLRANAARASLWLDTLPKVARVCYPGVRLQDQRQDGFVRLPNRSEIWIGGLDDKDRVEKILGNEYASIYLNECSQIPYSSVEVVLTRLAQTTDLKQRAYYDLNPVGKSHWTYRQFVEHLDPSSRLPLADPDDYQHAFLNPLDNAENLTPEYLASLRNMPERRRRRFFDGVYSEEIEGALWTLELLERARGAPTDVPRTLRRVVVAVDPSGTDGEEDARSDDVGIVVVGLGSDGDAYVLADLTCNLPPEGWGRRVVWAYEKYGADAVVAEVNFGGAMVRAVIQAASPNAPVPVYTVRASRGKAIRAEPVSALYGDPDSPGGESGSPTLACRVHHVWDPAPAAFADFGRLEDELLQFSTFGYQGTRSPNRADALVFGVSHLLLSEQAIALAAPIIVSFRAPSPDRGPAPVPYEPPSSTITLSPAEYSMITDIRGW
ncbi:MAG TPA: phage terminase large subunit [Actinomycetota bacterium]|nr:phage terminase large subunit [Actinomycetota bacterium]